MSECKGMFRGVQRMQYSSGNFPKGTVYFAVINLLDHFGISVWLDRIFW